ncbi:MAG: hypothetical protein JWN70_3141 [Planctomycetaceae bacterium]|nr:hypothetical protein [Planctomycetaceae bacterium]
MTVFLTIQPGRDSLPRSCRADFFADVEIDRIELSLVDEVLPHSIPVLRNFFGAEHKNGSGVL